jgi:hypothetical protein
MAKAKAESLYLPCITHRRMHILFIHHVCSHIIHFLIVISPLIYSRTPKTPIQEADGLFMAKPMPLFADLLAYPIPDRQNHHR